MLSVGWSNVKPNCSIDRWCCGDLYPTPALPEYARMQPRGGSLRAGRVTRLAMCCTKQGREQEQEKPPLIKGGWGGNTISVEVY